MTDDSAARIYDKLDAINTTLTDVRLDVSDLRGDVRSLPTHDQMSEAISREITACRQRRPSDPPSGASNRAVLAVGGSTAAGLGAAAYYLLQLLLGGG